MDSVEILKGELSEGEYVKAAILGWCVELVGVFFLFFILDVIDLISTHVGSYKLISLSRMT